MGLEGFPEWAGCHVTASCIMRMGRKRVCVWCVFLCKRGSRWGRGRGEQQILLSCGNASVFCALSSVRSRASVFFFFFGAPPPRPPCTVFDSKLAAETICWNPSFQPSERQQLLLFCFVVCLYRLSKKKGKRKGKRCRYHGGSWSREKKKVQPRVWQKTCFCLGTSL